MDKKYKSNIRPPGIIKRMVLMAALLVLLAACANPASQATPVPQVFDSPAQQINTFATLTIHAEDDPTHAHWWDYFAASIDIDGDVLVSGAPIWNRPAGEGTEAAYVYRMAPAGDWKLDATLIASDRDDGFQFDQFFGESVAIDGNRIAVGAPGADDVNLGDNTGAVYVFEYRDLAWVQTAKLNPAKAKLGAKFGRGLALDGDLLAVSGYPQAGSVSVFQHGNAGWSEMEPVPVPPAADGEPYEVLIDLYGDTLAVSTVIQTKPAVENNEQALIASLKCSGTVTLYERAGESWKETFRTTPQEASPFRMYNSGPFGISLALGGAAGRANLLAVGKPGFPGSGRDTGSVVTYARSDWGWAPQSELSLSAQDSVSGSLDWLMSQAMQVPTSAPSSGAAFFGAFVDIEGSRLGVVSTFANAAYVFERQESGWAYRYRITPGPQVGDDFMRRTVAMSGDKLVLGSPGELGGGDAFIFTVPK